MVIQVFKLDYFFAFFFYFFFMCSQLLKLQFLGHKRKGMTFLFYLFVLYFSQL